MKGAPKANEDGWTGAVKDAFVVDKRSTVAHTHLAARQPGQDVVHQRLPRRAVYVLLRRDRVVQYIRVADRRDAGSWSAKTRDERPARGTSPPPPSGARRGGAERWRTSGRTLFAPRAVDEDEGVRVEKVHVEQIERARVRLLASVAAPVHGCTALEHRHLDRGQGVHRAEALLQPREAD